MNTLEPGLAEEAARELSVLPAYIEKDWYAVQLLQDLLEWEYGEISVVFTGGTSLSKAHKIIQRFSEDIDVRITPDISGANRSKSRESLLTLLKEKGWEIGEEPIVRNSSKYVHIQLNYPVSIRHDSLRPHLKLELSYIPPRLETTDCAISSFIAELSQSESEIQKIACLNINEIAIEKLSALCWRSHIESEDGPDLVRHLHDLACLEGQLTIDDSFQALLLETVQYDLENRARLTGFDARTILFTLPDTLKDKGKNYTSFVQQASYAAGETVPTFEQAIDKLKNILGKLS